MAANQFLSSAVRWWTSCRLLSLTNTPKASRLWMADYNKSLQSSRAIFIPALLLPCSTVSLSLMLNALIMLSIEVLTTVAMYSIGFVLFKDDRTSWHSFWWFEPWHNAIMALLLVFNSPPLLLLFMPFGLWTTATTQITTPWFSILLHCCCSLCFQKPSFRVRDF